MDDKLFPKLPTTVGAGYPVYLSPIVGSGERICIGSVCLMRGGKPTFYRAYKKHESILPAALNLIVDFVTDHIEHHLMLDGEINDVTQFAQGVYLGDAIEGYFVDDRNIALTVFRNHSALYSGWCNQP